MLTNLILNFSKKEFKMNLAVIPKLKLLKLTNLCNNLTKSEFLIDFKLFSKFSLKEQGAKFQNWKFLWFMFDF